jgi:hypothetical protein
LIVSIGSGVLLIASLLTDILRVGFSVGTFGLLILVPFTIILWLFLAVWLLSDIEIVLRAHAYLSW